jgi:hypothetical protein
LGRWSTPTTVFDVASLCRKCGLFESLGELIVKQAFLPENLNPRDYLGLVIIKIRHDVLDLPIVIFLCFSNHFYCVNEGGVFEIIRRNCVSWNDKPFLNLPNIMHILFYFTSKYFFKSEIVVYSVCKPRIAFKILSRIYFNKSV